jgi:vesicle-fusing ATPase
MMALDEVHPAFGVSEEELEAAVSNGIIDYDDNVKVRARSLACAGMTVFQPQTIQNDGMLFVRQVSKSEHTQALSVLMHGVCTSR